MILFWTIAAAMLLAALCFLLPPLARRTTGQAPAEPESVEVYRSQRAELDADLASGAIDTAQHDEALRALKRRMLEELAPSSGGVSASGKTVKATMLAVAVLVPLAAVSLYFVLGNPDALSPQPATDNAHHTVTPEQIVAMVERLAERMKQNPNDAEGWSMLARSYAVLERYDDAVAAYAKAVELNPRNAQLHADYADVLAMAQGKKLPGKPAELIETALKLEPSNQKALALAGTLAFDQRRFDVAIEHWQRLLRTLPEGSDPARSVAGSIAAAQAALGDTTRTVAARTEASAPAKASISGTVSVQSGLTGKVSVSDTLFIYARAVDGPKMPLAVLRVAAKDFPVAFSLDESMAMSPALSLTQFPRVTVMARISKRGAATAQSGDLESERLLVDVGAHDLKITIDRVVQ